MKSKLKHILKLFRAKRYMLFTVQKDGSIDADSTDLKVNQFTAIHKYNQQVLEDHYRQEDAVNVAQQIINSDLW